MLMQKGWRKKDYSFKAILINNKIFAFHNGYSGVGRQIGMILAE